MKKRLLSYTKPYWGRLTVGMLLAIVVSIATGAAAWIVKPVLDDVFVSKDATILKILPIAFIIIYVVKGLARYGQSYIMRAVGQKIIMKIRNELYEHIQKMPLSFFHNTPSAILMSRITNDVTMLANVSSQVIADFFRQSFTLLLLSGLTFYREFRLAAIALIVLPFITIFIVNIGKKLRELSRRNQEKIGDMNIILQETFTGNKIVKAFGMEQYENMRFKKENRKLYDISIKEAKRYEMVSPIMEVFAAIGTGIVIWYGGYQVIKGTTTPGTFFSFLTALIMIYEPIKKLSTMNSVIQQSMAAAERVFNMLDAEIGIVSKNDAIELKEFKNKIIFEDVWFQYNSDNGMVLKGINLEVKKGEIIALVGSSGAGKSTLVDMIPRFYDTTKGRIKIEDYDIKDLTLASLRSHIGIVTQETILFNDTVKNNIAYGRVDASREEIHSAAQSAYTHEFIMEMSEGYDTIIGERGVKLSGGQRQRISIARAILKNPSILILDEATSSLDTESERMVQQALENLMKDRTTLVIAHRLSTVLNADRIIVMDSGRIAETGRHDELIRLGGIYNKLYEMQFKE
ncbi:MAG: lipid A export permease/ATP-binding protein MsbA [Nitrospinae bacterium RIFCSPLOWO2_02_FULL_39_110]|nr:MAG: lipid A export permease/ATP-binding protein MsbA [Nitrospinae bacterium RIFCSPHIGHO2_12_FULL_39_42]OGV99177.1 MAG: lipid A export permease/ATP-binding protein MsbA [Nitrospinae bacterium RIFCSPHIGHO2_02_39_11]OGW03142.1 MAG: lipid A export permease/ATP-binding protein MsbA [Nitrospinae bacterium RIFCSPHIGHO2_02_FULL_39_82]OGW04203.1 MAG: lipid A export permease/ATP-binding protein MsbA [Nitrospinae bacterium RIFCSPLOWO2_02_FULL_39_110]OGW05672.1 MAG: lipid A export permease/ATP-binding 